MEDPSDGQESIEEPSDERQSTPRCPHCRVWTKPDAQSCPSCFRALPGNDLAVTHGARRALDKPADIAAIRERRDEIVKHLGGDVSTIELDLATDYARLDLIITTVWNNIEARGVVSAKGASRSAVNMLLVLLDRRLRLAITLGIERKVKPVNPLDAVRAAVIEANR